MKYESTILKRLIDTYGVVGNPRYLSEIIKEFIVRGKELYPQLFTYQADWLAHIDEFGLTPEYVVSYTGQQIYAPHTKERPVKRAILKGSTKYRDIDTGEVLDAFEDGRNLELVSVKMPVLTTSNEDGTKTNILTANEDVTLRGIGDVKDELNLLTGELTQNIAEAVLSTFESYAVSTSNGFYYMAKTKVSNDISPSHTLIIGANKFISKIYSEGGENFKIQVSSKEDGTYPTRAELSEYLSQNPLILCYIPTTSTIKTVDLTVKDQNDIEVSQLSSFNGGTHFSTSSQLGSLLPSISVDVVTDLEETLNLCSTDGNTL